MMKIRRTLAGRLSVALVWALVLIAAVQPGLAEDDRGNVFERSVLKGGLDQAAKDYYAAVWTSLGFFQGADSARRLLAQFDVLNQRRQVDSLINVLFLPLDTDPVAAGNSFLEGLAEKIAFTRNRGFLHSGGSLIDEVFDDIGLLVLLNGLPDLAYVREVAPLLCSLDLLVAQYQISWTGEDFYFQEDCFGYWRLFGREFPRGGESLPPKAARIKILAEELTSGVALQDTLPTLSENSVTVHPVSIFDTADWGSSLTVVNLGFRARDFVRDSSSWKRLLLHGAISVQASGGSPFVLDSVAARIDHGRVKPDRDDFVVIQKIERGGRADSSGRILEWVLGVDIANGKNRHWKKSIRFPVGWIGDSLSLGYGWPLNPHAAVSGYLGGRPPLVQNLMTPSDSMILFLQLIGAVPDDARRYRTHVRLRFIREEDRRWEAALGQLYRLGKEPVGSESTKDLVAAASILGVIETSSPNSNVTFSGVVPAIREGSYRIVCECYHTSGGDARPFAVVIFDDIQIKRKGLRASN